jgi:hypothetical protein
MSHEIIPQNLAIKAMRDSGYRDTVHALAELIDNSIQAGESINTPTVVEVICVDREKLVSQRTRRHIETIAVYDNACGMDATTLRLALQFGNGLHLAMEQQKGIGKFGMGLPNSSISQCCRVEVWSWQNDKCLHSYLDVEQILKGKMVEVPEPKTATIPAEWRKLIRDQIGDHGTLVVWKELDRVRFRSSKALLENAEFLVGRMYRHFINEGKAKIRLAAFDDNENAAPVREWYVRPNDPLYLMTKTCAPAPFDADAAFDFFAEESIEVVVNGKKHEVKLRYSITKPEPRQQHGGSSEIGRDTQKNQGVSVVRAKREIETNRTFDNRSDTRDRWWGVEVMFDAVLDAVFGVTNNKQAATNFFLMDLDEDAALEGMTPEQYREQLKQTHDPRLAIYEISHHIQKTLSTIRGQVERMREGVRKKGQVVAPPGSAEEIATRAIKQRRQQIGDKGRSDQSEQMPLEQRKDELTQQLVEQGMPEQEAKQIAVEAVTRHIKIIFQEADIPGAVIFDVKSKAGTIIVLINSRHPASKDLFELLRESNTEVDTPALKALKLLLSAWGRLEDEAGDQRRQQLEDIRADWGRIARDFLQAAAE